MTPETVEEPLSSSMRGEIEPRLAAVRLPLAERTLSDYSFSNMYLFREVHQYRYRRSPRPAIVGLTYDGISMVFPLYDLRSATDDELLFDQGGHSIFFPLARELVDGLDNRRFRIEAVRSDSDYLYPRDAFERYDGIGLGEKRSAVSRLLDRYRIRIDALTAESRNDAMHVLAGWLEDKGKGESEADGSACRDALRGTGNLALLPGLVFYVDRTPIGFVIYELLNPAVAVIRFAKGRSEFNGIFPYMFHILSVQLKGVVSWFNLEQDLGIENFRRTKLSYRPSALLPKYRLRVVTE